jgi:hypothetical protein
MSKEECLELCKLSCYRTSLSTSNTEHANAYQIACIVLVQPVSPYDGVFVTTINVCLRLPTNPITINVMISEMPILRQTWSQDCP